MMDDLTEEEIEELRMQEAADYYGYPKHLCEKPRHNAAWNHALGDPLV